MANREIQPPGGDLGVNTSGRSGLVNFLAARRLFGDGGGGPRGKDYKNEAKLFKFQQQVLDERERAQAAREEMLYGNKAGIDLGAEKVSQDQGRAHYQSMLDMVRDAKAQGASGEQLQQLVTSFDLETPRGGRARGTFDIVGGPKPPTGPAPDGPGPVVSDDPPIIDGPGPGPKEPAKKRRTAADVRLDMKTAEDEYDAAVAAGASDEDLADLASKGSMLSDEHYLLARKEGGQRDKGARKKAGLPAAGGTAGYTFESLDGGANDSRVRSTKSRGETLKKLQENVDYGKESLGIGTVGDDGGIDLGETGARPAPSGESGNTQGPQFQ